MGRTEDVAPGVGGRQWELLVVNDDKIVNAAASYGNVVVFTGILPVAKDEQGLAAVLGHGVCYSLYRQKLITNVLDHAYAEIGHVGWCFLSYMTHVQTC